MQGTIRSMVTDRKFDLAVERAFFLTTLNHLFASGSDRLYAKWMVDYGVMGTEELELHQPYRPMAWLGEELSDNDHKSRTFVPRCTKDLVEEEFFWFTQPVFITRFGFL